MITHCISTYRNLPYLKLAIESVRKYSYYKDAPFIIHSDKFNDDGTNEWLLNNSEKYNLTLIIRDLNPSGIGSGMNVCAENVETEYINFLHSDFYVTPNWDLELMKVHQKHPNKKLWVNSFRIEPNKEETERIIKNIIGGRTLSKELVLLEVPDTAEDGNVVPVTFKINCS